jgi:hypothetical protein
MLRYRADVWLVRLFCGCTGIGNSLLLSFSTVNETYLLISLISLSTLTRISDY